MTFPSACVTATLANTCGAIRQADTMNTFQKSAAGFNKVFMVVMKAPVNGLMNWKIRLNCTDAIPL